MRRLLIVLAALALILSVLLGLRLLAQEARLSGPAGGSGEIEAETVSVTTRLSTRIERLHVREGEAVEEGQLLVSLDCADTDAALAEARARLASTRAQAQAAEAAIASARQNRQLAVSRRAAARAEVQALQTRQQAAERHAGRMEALSQDVAESVVDQARAEADTLAGQLRAARAQAAAAGEQVQAAEAGIAAAEAQARAAEAGAAAAEAGVTRAEVMAGECALKAPRDAVVERLPHEAGELVGPGTAVARLIDLSEVTATFYLPNAELAAAKPGDDARIVADAWPGEVFEGRVRTVAFEAEFTPRNIQTRTDRDRLVYPVEVVVENPEGKLRPGMPVEVTLPGTERSGAR